MNRSCWPSRNRFRTCSWPEFKNVLTLLNWASLSSRLILCVHFLTVHSVSSTECTHWHNRSFITKRDAFDNEIKESVAFLHLHPTKMLELLVAVLTCLTVYYFYARQKPKNYPPGPPNLPFLGSIPFLERDMRKNITKLHKKYGPSNFCFIVFWGDRLA